MNSKLVGVSWSSLLSALVKQVLSQVNFFIRQKNAGLSVSSFVIVANGRNQHPVYTAWSAAASYN